MKHAEAAKKKNHVEFDILCDPGNDYAAQLGLRFEFTPELRGAYESLGLDLARFNGDASWTLPMPARFIADASGVIRYAESNPDYTTRPEPEETVEALRKVIA